jgi:hypothetical protein
VREGWKRNRGQGEAGSKKREGTSRKGGTRPGGDGTKRAHILDEEHTPSQRALLQQAVE